MNKYYWLCVDADEYELPIAVAETANELGKMCGIRGKTIIDAVHKQHNGRENGYKYVKVRQEID